MLSAQYVNLYTDNQTYNNGYPCLVLILDMRKTQIDFKIVSRF